VYKDIGVLEGYGTSTGLHEYRNSTVVQCFRYITRLQGYNNNTGIHRYRSSTVIQGCTCVQEGTQVQE